MNILETGNHEQLPVNGTPDLWIDHPTRATNFPVLQNNSQGKQLAFDYQAGLFTLALKQISIKSVERSEKTAKKENRAEGKTYNDESALITPGHKQEEHFPVLLNFSIHRSVISCLILLLKSPGRMELMPSIQLP